MKTITNTMYCALAFACFGLFPNAQAVVPPPDGGYPGGNTAEGQNALLSLTSGQHNTAVGYLSLRANTTASFNTALGSGTLLSNTADANTATGAFALLSNTTGTSNTANGAAALLSNTEGSANTANGYQALAFNTTGGGNTANGYQALYSNTVGGNNTATGFEALYSNTTGEGNSAIGRTALRSNTTGGFNTAFGRSALFDNTTGEGNIALGYLSGGNLTTGDNNIDIGNLGFPGESGTIRIGSNGTQTRTFIAGISGTTASGGVAVFVNASGQLGTLTSSRRFKDQIKRMDKASEALFAFKPVSFRYKKEIDPEGIPQFGLVAEEVEQVNPDLVVRDKEGKPYSVRYDVVNAMLLNEFLKEHKRLEEQQATIAELKSTIANQQRVFQSKLAGQEKQIEALTSGLQKVSMHLELEKRLGQAVAEN
jgi:Chaperone of endosialidase